jgi:hypothetical protein
MEFWLFLQLLINGIIAGSLYALLGISFTAIFAPPGSSISCMPASMSLPVIYCTSLPWDGVAGSRFHSGRGAAGGDHGGPRRADHLFSPPENGR